MKILFRILCLLSLLGAAGGAWGYSSVTVPIEEPVYRQLDKLAAHGLIEDRLLGQRPYVRAEIARQIAEAMKNYPQFESKASESAKDYLGKILAALKSDYRDELIQNGAIEGVVPTVQGQLIDQGRMEFALLHQNPATFPINNGFGGIAATTRSLVENRGGRHYQDGLNLSFETTHWLRLGKYFSIQAEPRFQVQGVEGNAPAENKVFAQRLNGRFTWNKLDIEIGRDSINWGPSELGGIAFSNNARPSDFIKLSSVMPFRYPFFFKKLGINEWSLVVANLGPEQHFSDSWLVSYKNSNRGSRYLEIGFGQQFLVGGDGAPHLSLGRGIGEFFGVGGDDAKKASDRNFDFEVIGGIPQLRGMQVYTQLHFEDLDFDPSVLFTEDLSILGGIYVPRLNDSGTLDLRVEYRRLTPRYSRHEVFTDGMTENGLLIGDPLGPDAWGLSAEMKYDLSFDTLLSFGLRFARRSGDLYLVNYSSDQVEGSSTTVDRPTETRVRTTAAVRHQFNSHLVARLGVGFEGVHNFNFRKSDDAFQWLGEAGLTFYFKPYLGLGRSR
ncbi:MAG: capsule assembly Wzi family protein [Deltaproteobacteria bacterium]|nr:capsule assembly Wzi family protein [Deltaproteobacteria bacterium]